MKKLSFVFALMLSVVLFSCKKDEVNPVEELEMSTSHVRSSIKGLIQSRTFDPSYQNSYSNGEYAVPPFELSDVSYITILSQEGPAEWSVNDDKKINMKTVRYAKDYYDRGKCHIQIHLKTGQVYLKKYNITFPHLVR